MDYPTTEAQSKEHARKQLIEALNQIPLFYENLMNNPGIGPRAELGDIELVKKLGATFSEFIKFFPSEQTSELKDQIAKQIKNLRDLQNYSGTDWPHKDSLLNMGIEIAAITDSLNKI